MAGTFRFELVSPERILLAGDAEQVLLPGSEGDMTVLPGHAPVITSLRPGFLEIMLAGSRHRVFVKSGFAEVEPDRLTVLAQRALELPELTMERIAEEIRIAEEELANAKDDEARRHLDRAIEQFRAINVRATESPPRAHAQAIV